VLATEGRGGPVYLRVAIEPRGCLPAGDASFEPGRARTLRATAGRPDVCLFALGPTAFDALEAARLLESAGIEAAVVLVSSLRPFEEGDIVSASLGARLVVTLENHALEGGLGSRVSEAMAETPRPPRVLRAGVAERDFAPGSPAYLRSRLGLDAPALARRVTEALAGP
jgi:transketolase